MDLRDTWSKITKEKEVRNNREPNEPLKNNFKSVTNIFLGLEIDNNKRRYFLKQTN